MRKQAKKGAVVFTIGHSTRSLEEFIGLLQAHRVELIVDVRTVPKSRFNPQFNTGALAKNLKAHSIGYLHIPELGGLRRPRKDSINTAWENASFRGFADYMQTEEFGRGLQALIAASARQQAAIMCAEAVPWRCHRSLISDALLARGIVVKDIMTANPAKEHALTAWAVKKGEKIFYPKKKLRAA